jgi:hypothetical protein
MSLLAAVLCMIVSARASTSGGRSVCIRTTYIVSDGQLGDTVSAKRVATCPRSSGRGLGLKFGQGGIVAGRGHGGLCAGVGSRADNETGCIKWTSACGAHGDAWASAGCGTDSGFDRVMSNCPGGGAKCECVGCGAKRLFFFNGGMSSRNASSSSSVIESVRSSFMVFGVAIEENGLDGGVGSLESGGSESSRKSNASLEMESQSLSVGDRGASSIGSDKNARCNAKSDVKLLWSANNVCLAMSAERIGAQAVAIIYPKAQQRQAGRRGVAGS